MRTIMLGACLCLSACTITTSRGDEHAEAVRNATNARLAQEAALDAAKKAHDAEVDRILAERRERDAHPEMYAPEPVEPKDVCADGIEARIHEYSEYLKRADHLAALQDWESDHCKIVDRSKPVVRVVQDSRGEYHTIEGRDRGVDRECDSTPPEEIRTRWAMRMTAGLRPSPPNGAHCQWSDAEKSEIAARYWGHGVRPY